MFCPRLSTARQPVSAAARPAAAAAARCVAPARTKTVRVAATAPVSGRTATEEEYRAKRFKAGEAAASTEYDSSRVM
ncbi:hypothetical protein PLESTM_000485000 [Pleodorina starrii]|nr:hypothetical protein PLESTM_000485000 [Pleodorina starrii]